MNGLLIVIFQVAVLLYSVTIHEVSHGLAAYSMGDNTAKYLGRLTLNPFKHLDLFGSIMLPLLLFVTGLPVFGYAKPVPYNPNNLNDQKWGPAKVAAAGPASNLILAVMFGLVLRFMPDIFSSPLIPQLLGGIVYINLTLAIFNLFPVPPLDGHWIFFSLLPSKLAWIRNYLMQYSMIFFVIFLLFGLQLVFPIVGFLFHLITGSAV